MKTRIRSFLMAMLLVLSMTATTLAAGTDTAAGIELRAEKLSGQVVIHVDLTANKATNGRIAINYDAARFEYVAYSSKDAGLTSVNATNEGEVIFAWVGSNLTETVEILTLVFQYENDELATYTFTGEVEELYSNGINMIASINTTDSVSVRVGSPAPAPVEPEEPDEPETPDDPVDPDPVDPDPVDPDPVDPDPVDPDPVDPDPVDPDPVDPDPVEPEEPTDPEEPVKEVVETKEETDEEGNKTETTTYDDGSTTVVETKVDGTVTETNTNTDGSSTAVETKVDGTVTETNTNTDGSSTAVETKVDGTVTETNKTADGTTASKTTDAEGNVTEVKAAVSEEAVAEAEVVTIPVEVAAAQTAEEAVAVEIEVPETVETVKVEIPVENVTAGTVIVLVDEEGNETIVPAAAMTENGLAIAVEGNVTVKVVDNTKEFVDGEEQPWASEAITFVSSRELFNGVSEDTFGVNTNMTRAMALAVLARLDGVDAYGADWAEKGVQWAVNYKLSDGTTLSDGSNLDQDITREQLAVLLYRYAGKPEVTGNLDAFTDAASVSSWAADAMAWVVENGIINGMGDGTVNPQGYAVRAQVATILTRFINL